MAEARSALAGSTDHEVVITRRLDAPRALVWKAWTEPKHMAEWWGPKSFTNPVCDMDVRPGGAWRIVMRGPDGAEYPLKGVYREVVEPRLLVMVMDLTEHPDASHDFHRSEPRQVEGPAVARSALCRGLRGTRRQDGAHHQDELRLGDFARRHGQDGHGARLEPKPRPAYGALGTTLIQGCSSACRRGFSVLLCDLPLNAVR